MIRLDTFVALEDSLSQRLSLVFSAYFQPLLAEIEGALQKGEYEKAVELVNKIDLSQVSQDTRPYVQWITDLSMLFGASRVTARPGTSVVGLGHEKTASAQAVDVFTQGLVNRGGMYLREQALQLIALRRDMEGQTETPVIKDSEASKKAWLTRQRNKAQPQPQLEPVTAKLPDIDPDLTKTATAVAQKLSTKYGVNLRLGQISIPDAMAIATGVSVLLSPEHFTKAGLAKYAVEWDGMVNNTSLEGLITHEVGHVLTRPETWGSAKAHQKAWELIESDYKQANESKTFSPPSAYGQENSSEHAAEAFSIFHLGDGDPNGPWAKETGERARALWTTLLKMRHDSFAS